MSIEDNLQALLLGAAAVTGLVGQNVAQNAVPEGGKPPLITWATKHTYELGLDNTVLSDQCFCSLECWGGSGEQADAIADAVQVAVVAAAAAGADVCVVDRDSAFDPDLQLDCTKLTAVWWT